MDTAASIATIAGTVLVILGLLWRFGKWQSHVDSRLDRQDEVLGELHRSSEQLRSSNAEMREDVAEIRTAMQQRRRGGLMGLLATILLTKGR